MNANNKPSHSRVVANTSVQPSHTLGSIEYDGVEYKPIYVLGFCPVTLLKFWSTAVSGPGTPSTGPHDRLKSGYEGVRDNRDFGQALLVA